MRACKLCGLMIDFIKTEKGKAHPIDPKLIPADGKRTLVFPNGSIGRTHPDYQKVLSLILRHVRNTTKSRKLREKNQRRLKEGFSSERKSELQF